MAGSKNKYGDKYLSDGILCVISRGLCCQTQVRHRNRTPKPICFQLLSPMSLSSSCQLLLSDGNFYILHTSVKSRLNRVVSHPTQLNWHHLAMLQHQNGSSLSLTNTTPAFEVPHLCVSAASQFQTESCGDNLERQSSRTRKLAKNTREHLTGLFVAFPCGSPCWHV